MADARRLRRGALARWLALVALVLLLHALTLDWLALQLAPSAVLRPMTEPLFTRILQQQAPEPVTAPAVAEATPPPRPAIRTIAPKPRRVASEPAREPPAEPQPPAPPPAPDTQQSAQAAPPATDAAAAELTPAPPASAAAPAEGAAPPQATPAQAAASAAGEHLDGWPTDTRLTYHLGGVYRGGELHGRARVQWLRQQQRYETRIDIDVYLLASLAVTSQGQVTASGLKPEAYEETRRSGRRSARLREETIELGNGRRVPRPPGVQDTASQFVDLSHRFAAGLDRLEVGGSVSFWMARPGGVDFWTYDIVEREMLDTPKLGAVEAYHLKPRPIANARGTITAEMWFAPSLQYLPVRIRVNMDGATHVDLIVEDIEQR